LNELPIDKRDIKHHMFRILLGVSILDAVNDVETTPLSLRMKRYVLRLRFTKEELWDFVMKTSSEERFKPIFFSLAEQLTTGFNLDITQRDLYTKIVPDIDVSIRKGAVFSNPRSAISNTELFRDTSLPDTFVKVYANPREGEDLELARTIVNAVSPNQNTALKSAKDMVGLLCAFKGVTETEAVLYEDFSEYERIRNEELSGLARLKDVTPEFERAAMTLNNVVLRDTLLQLKRRGRILASDFKTLSGSDSDKNIIKELVDSRLVDVTYAIVCTSTNDLLVSVSTKEEINDIIRTNALCPKCRKLLRDENIEEVFEVSSLGEDLTQESKWMTIVLRRFLIDCGCKPENIFLDVMINNDQLDVIALFWGRIIVFELKDRNFELGDMYKFNSKSYKFAMTIPRGQIWKEIVVTTGEVVQAVKDWIPEGSRERVRFIENSSELLESEIKRMLNRVLTLRSYYILRGKNLPIQRHLWGIWSQILSRKFAPIALLAEEEKSKEEEPTTEEMIEEELFKEETREKE
jgi:hypothetical protein